MRAALAAYRREHGTTRVPYGYRTGEGFALGPWLGTQRIARRDGTIGEQHIAAPNELGMDWGSRSE